MRRLCVVARQPKSVEGGVVVVLAPEHEGALDPIGRQEAFGGVVERLRCVKKAPNWAANTGERLGWDWALNP